MLLQKKHIIAIVMGVVIDIVVVVVGYEEVLIVGTGVIGRRST